MSNEEFSESIAKGLGRAYLQVLRQGDRALQTQVLHACLHDLAYDQQCEASRSEWLLSIINLSQNPAYYHNRIIEALAYPKALVCTYQLYELCGLLAHQGVENAAAAIRHRYSTQSITDADLGSYQIVDLDGMDSFTSQKKWERNLAETAPIGVMFPFFTMLVNRLGMAIVDIVKNQPHESLTWSLRWAYKNTPCSYCRNSTVEALIKHNMMTTEIAKEAQYDCVKETRLLAKAYLEGQP